MNIFQKKQTDVMEVYYLDIIQLTQTNSNDFSWRNPELFTLPFFLLTPPFFYKIGPFDSANVNTDCHYRVYP